MNKSEMDEVKGESLWKCGKKWMGWMKELGGSQVEEQDGSVDLDGIDGGWK